MSKLKDYLYGICLLIGAIMIVGTLMGIAVGTIAGSAYAVFRLFT
jgi:hypothetical protein